MPTSPPGGALLAVVDVLAVATLVFLGACVGSFLELVSLTSSRGRLAVLTGFALLGPLGVGIERGRSERPRASLALAVSLAAALATFLFLPENALVPSLLGWKPFSLDALVQLPARAFGTTVEVQGAKLPASPLAAIVLGAGVPLVFLGTRLSRRDDAWRAAARDGPPDATPELARKIAGASLPLPVRALLLPVSVAALPLAFAGLVLIRSYQITLSRLMPNQCRFEPHCSKYGFEAVRAHGFFRGSALTVFRVVRCQPFCRAGHDPVPPRSPSPSSVSHARRAEEEK